MQEKIARDQDSQSLISLRRSEHRSRLGLESTPLHIFSTQAEWEQFQVTAGTAILDVPVRLDDAEWQQSLPPTRREVIDVLKRRYHFVYLSKTQPDHFDFPLCWRGRSSRPWRTWFIVSHEELFSDRVTSVLPSRQWLEENLPSPVLHFPALRSGLAAQRVGSDAAEILGEGERYVVHGLEADTVLSVTGDQAAESIASRLGPDWSAEEVYFALSRLSTWGLLEEAGARFSVWEEDFWRHAGVSRRIAARRMAEAVIAVTGPPAIRQAIEDWGLRVAHPNGDPPTLDVVTVADYTEDATLADINRRAIEQGRPWFLAKVTGRFAWMGPLFQPGKSPCCACLEARIRENRPTGLGAGSSDRVSAAAVERCVSGLVQWIGDRRGWLESEMLTLDTWDLTYRRHPVLSRVHCPVCGTVPQTPGLESARIDLDTIPDERVPLERVARHLRSLVSPLTGLVPDPHEVAGAEPFYIFTSRVNGALGSRANDAALRDDSWLVLGKSLNRLEAEVGCLAEAVERYSAGFHPGEALVAKRWPDWKDQEAVHPASVVLYSELQQRNRDAWNAACGYANTVFPPYQEEHVTEWKPIWSLTHGCGRWMTADLCFIDYPCQPELRFCLGDSNGCASGATLAEALLRALLELVERDAASIWWYNRLRRPAVPEAAHSSPGVTGARSLLGARGRELCILDLTNDLGIPAAAAISWRTRQGDQPLLGFAADLTMEQAASRAAAEVCQSAPWEDRRLGDSDWDRWVRSARIATESWLLADTTAVAMPPATWPTASRAAVAAITERLNRADLEVLVCDLTRADANFPVVRAIVPGLRHVHAQFAPGRLYDVPVKLGWLKQPLAESELNPFLFPV